MPAESIIDRLEREHGGVRQYIATLLVVGGASRAQVAEAIARKYNIPAPTGRSVTAWKNGGDPALQTLIQEMEAARRDLAPGDDPTKLIRESVDPAEAVSDLFALLDEVPALAELMHRANLDPDFPDDAVEQVLRDGPHDDLETVCRERLGDWNIYVAKGADPADVARVERAAAAGTLSESYNDRTRRRKREAATAAPTAAKSRERYVDGPELD